MTDDVPDRAVRAFDEHADFTADGSRFVSTATEFDAHVTVSETDDWDLHYLVTVHAPLLSSVTEDDVHEVVEDGWFETFELRLEDAPGAVVQNIELGEFEVRRSGGDAIVTFGFEYGNAGNAPEIAHALIDYVEGTYMEGVIPGYTYLPPVADMVSRAHQSSGGSPL
ncbi:MULTISPECIES: DUF5813 family protein [unclassified Haladaptatus]|uniref:DUF5813 family protein n=1 Tax=unclassified Haladaptatus TaxID=2622732 RepID=UPI0023E7FEAB|nr:MULTISPECIES: DUF5813 family protein [unclassified Haladaptatus]